ncbi:hypothetical protein ACE01N_20310 [Saccharicrinis sp. FJH2]|uniref:hypothetical protein n=1 Tax=Saccharicrinis sp. FJH65 TaxID=3344659 RepID=UPI0035F35C6B
MKIKNRKRILKTILGLIFIVVISFSSADWYKRKKIQGKFFDIEYSIYKSMINKKISNQELYILYCDTIAKFVKNNPINSDFRLEINDCTSQTSTKRFDVDKPNFILQVQMIGVEYRQSKDRANIRLFLILIVSQILLIVIKNLIDKKFNDTGNYSDK